MTGPILSAHGLIKRYGRVTALDHADFELLPGEILAVIGDNGAGKSTLIKSCPERSRPTMAKSAWPARSCISARRWTRAPPGSRQSTSIWRCRRRCPSPTICSSVREPPPPWPARALVPQARPRRHAERGKAAPELLGLLTIQNIRRRWRHCRAGGGRAWPSRGPPLRQPVVIMDEPTAALGVKESGQVLELMLDVRGAGCRSC